MFDSRFTGTKDVALTKLTKYMNDLEKEISSQRMNAEFKKRKERTLAMVGKLHAECLAFTPMNDWVTRLSSYHLKNGCHILFGRRNGIDWHTVMLDDTNYFKLYQVFVVNNKEYFEGTPMPEKLSSPRTAIDKAAGLSLSLLDVSSGS